MKDKNITREDDKLDQLGGTDQVEQLAADLAVKGDREKVTDKDRREALKQLNEIAPPVIAEPTKK